MPVFGGAPRIPGPRCLDSPPALLPGRELALPTCGGRRSARTDSPRCTSRTRMAATTNGSTPLTSQAAAPGLLAARGNRIAWVESERTHRPQSAVTILDVAFERRRASIAATESAIIFDRRLRGPRRPRMAARWTATSSSSIPKARSDRGANRHSRVSLAGDFHSLDQRCERLIASWPSPPTERRWPPC